MSNLLSNLTVIILTYKTNSQILSDCIKSIDKSVNINLIENSDSFAHKDLIKNINKDVNIFCTGKNLGYGGGNNFGLKKTETKYALILNPDVICDENYFLNIQKYINDKINFTIIGSQYKKDKIFMPAGFFDTSKDKDFKKNFSLGAIEELTDVEWVVGCSMLINLDKFNEKEIFDENFFLYFEEFDLCKQISKAGGKILSSKLLLVDHLGFKGSFAANKDLENQATKLRNWHWMWSSFYYYKKNDGYLYALKKTIGKFIKSFLKAIYFSIIYNNHKRTMYLYRFLGLFNSIIGKKSWFRINF